MGEGAGVELARKLLPVFLLDRPQEARWLDDEQKKIILDALAADRAEKKPAQHTRHQLLAALKDPRVYILAAGWGTVPLCGTILNYWTPTAYTNGKVFFNMNGGSYQCSATIVNRRNNSTATSSSTSPVAKSTSFTSRRVLSIFSSMKS